MRNIAIETIVILVVATFVSAQGKPNPTRNASSRYPEIWGQISGDEWHRHEALYWACRTGVSAETAKQWQKAAGEMDMAQNIQLVRVSGQELVIFEEMGGTAHNPSAMHHLRRPVENPQVLFFPPTGKC